MNNPKCKYCQDDTEMQLHSNKYPFDYGIVLLSKFHYRCPKCGSRSPVCSTKEEAYAAAIKSERPKEKWKVVTRHEHYPSGKPYTDLFCPVCGRKDNNGDGTFCGYCGAEMEVR